MKKAASTTSAATRNRRCSSASWRCSRRRILNMIEGQRRRCFASRTRVAFTGGGAGFLVRGAEALRRHEIRHRLSTDAGPSRIAGGVAGGEIMGLTEPKFALRNRTILLRICLDPQTRAAFRSAASLTSSALQSPGTGGIATYVLDGWGSGWKSAADFSLETRAAVERGR